jgi:PilZ domain-containing protein
MARRDITREGETGNRRRGERFPIRAVVFYKVLGKGSVAACGTGTTLNFSRSGIQFTTEEDLPVGSSVEISVDWPAELDGLCALKFVGVGRVVRSEGNRAAVKIEHYEFRTRGKLRQPQNTSADGGVQPNS